MGATATPQEPENIKPEKISLFDYFEQERISKFRHEYSNGSMIRMAYASETHGILVHNLDRLIGNCLVDKDCLIT